MYPTNNPIITANGVIPTTQTMPQTGNWLPSEKFALLQKGLNQFKLSVTEEELAKGQCNHYNTNGTSAIINDPDGSGACTCAICGTKFHPIDISKEDVKVVTQQILDILNTIKIMYLSIDKQAALEFFQIIPFVNKIPELYEIAVNDFKKYEGVNNFNTTNTMNPFAMYSMMMSGMQPNMMGGMGMGMPMQQPMMNMQPQQPNMGMMGGMNMGMPMQQPMMNMQPQMNVPVQQNPMYGGMVMQQPQQPMVNTNMPVQQTAPQAPANVTPTVTPTVTPQPAPAAEVTVGTEFKK